VTVALLVLGAFLIGMIIASSFLNSLKRYGEIHVYLSDDLAPQDYVRIDEAIKSDQDVADMRYVSKEDALKNFARSSGIDVKDLLGTNPLPAQYIVQGRTLKGTAALADRLGKIPGVSDVRYGQQFLAGLANALRAVQVVFALTILLLISASFSSINNIIRLSVYARRREIRIMQLVGATKWFVRWPFIFEGGAVGLFGGVVATIILVAGYNALIKLLEAFEVFVNLMVTPDVVAATVAAVIIPLGLVIGVVSSYFTLNTFLFREEQMVLESERLKRGLGFRD
jgi:cell division transport system permease protein